MPLFQPRTRVEILRAMIARVVARSSLVGVLRNSVVFHILAAAADEDAEQYWQMANLRKIFSIDKATGSDLDERAREIQPATITRRESLFASGEVSFKRVGTTGNLLVPAGTVVAAEDASGQIKYRTTINGTILDGVDTVTGVSIVALEAGSRGNASLNTVIQMVTRVPGVVSVFNPADITNGADRESDARFRARLKLYVQALSRGTPIAVRSFALSVQLDDGRRVLFANVVEPITPTGDYEVYIDDGTGAIEEIDTSFASTEDVLIASAAGGEINAYTSVRPLVDDPTLVVRVNATPIVRGVDYEINVVNGQVEFASPLVAADAVTANYNFYTGLIQETQRVIDGDPATTLTHPGVRAAGTRAIVKAAAPVAQTLAANIAVLDNFKVDDVIEQVKDAVSRYINGLDIGQHVIVAEIIEQAMDVPGMFNFQISNLSGTFPAVDQYILPNQVARLSSANLTIT